MRRRYPPELRRQVVELVRSGTRVAVLADTFGMSEVTIYNWLKQDRIDRGEELGRTTDQQMKCCDRRQYTSCTKSAYFHHFGCS